MKEQTEESLVLMNLNTGLGEGCCLAIGAYQKHRPADASWVLLRRQLFFTAFTEELQGF